MELIKLLNSLCRIIHFVQNLGEIQVNPNVLYVSSSVIITMNVKVPCACQLAATKFEYIQGNQTRYQRNFPSTSSVQQLEFDLVILFLSEVDINETSTLLYESLKLISGLNASKIIATSRNKSWTTQILENIRNWPGNQPFGSSSQIYIYTADRSFAEIYSFRDKVFIESFELRTGISGTYGRRRRNLKQSRVSVGHVKNWNIKSTTGAETVGWNYQTVSITYQYLAYMQDFLNFSLKTKSASIFSKWNHESSSWGGIAKLVEDEQVDIAISASAMFARVANDFRYLSPQTYAETPTMIFVPGEQRSTSSKGHATFYARVFHVDVWALIFLALLLLFFIRVLITTEVDHSLWLTISHFLLKDWPLSQAEKESAALRILSITMSMMCLVFYAFFSSHLISSLAVENHVIEENIDSLVEKKYSFGICNGSYLIDAGTDNLHDATPTKRIDRLFSNLDQTMAFPSLDAGVEHALKTPKYALIYENERWLYTTLLSQISTSQMCSLTQRVYIPEYNVIYSAFVRKDSQLAQHFNHARVTMMERGIVRLFLHKQAVLNKAAKLTCTQPSKRPFDMTDVKLPYHILATGWLMSLFIIFCEEMLKFASKRRNDCNNLVSEFVN